MAEQIKLRVGEEIEAGCRRVIVGWWKKLTKSEPGQRWQDVWQSGLIDSATANEWAREVWGPGDDDFMMADMALGMYDQCGADITRDSLVEYAVNNDYVWALEGLQSSHNATAGNLTLEPAAPHLDDQFPFGIYNGIRWRRRTVEHLHMRGPWKNIEAVEYVTLEWVD